jgi:hypothetical protein
VSSLGDRKLKCALAAAAVLFAGVTLGAIGVYHQDFFKEQYQWRVVMRPSVLTAEQEREKAANPGSTFKECVNGWPATRSAPIPDR